MLLKHLLNTQKTSSLYFRNKVDIHSFDLVDFVYGLFKERDYRQGAWSSRIYGPLNKINSLYQRKEKKRP